MTDRRDKSGPWVKNAIPDDFYMGRREWYFPFNDLGPTGRLEAWKASK